MLKFISRVIIAGEVNDLRKDWKRKRVLKKANKKRIDKNILTDIAKNGKLTTYSEYYGRGAIQLISGAIGILLAPVLPPLVLIAPITMAFGIKNLIKAGIIYNKSSKKINNIEREEKIKSNKFIQELRELQEINRSNEEV